MANTSSLLPDFSELISRTYGLLAVIVTDNDGVIVFRSPTLSDPLLDENALAGFSVAFSTASERAEKILTGMNINITSTYENYVFVQSNFSPLVISLIGNEKANVGVLKELIGDVREALEPVRYNLENVIV